MSRVIIAAVFAITVPSAVSAQSFCKEQGVLTIRESFDTKAAVQPAFLQVTAPIGKPASVNIGVGMKYSCEPATSNLIEFGPFTEYVRNTEADKKAESFKAGLAGEIDFFQIGESRRVSPTLLIKSNYKRDAVKSTDELQGSLVLTAVTTGNASPIARIIHNRTTGLFQIENHLYGGLEYDFRVAGPDSAARTEPRWLFRAQVALLPFAAEINDGVQFMIDYTYREALGDRHAIYKYVEAKGDFMLISDDKRKAGVSVAYAWGNDPSRSLKDQDLIRVAFSIQMVP